MTDVFHRSRVVTRLAAHEEAKRAPRASMPADTRLRWGGVAAGPFVAVAVGPGAAVVVVLAALVWVPLRQAHDRRARRARAATDLAGALEELARALRTGASLRTALVDAASSCPGRLGSDLRAVAARVGAGQPFDEALTTWAEGSDVPGALLAAAALGLAFEAGGPQARAVDGVAATLRQRLAAAAQVRTLATQARASAMVIGLAPLGFGALASATDPRTAHFLFGSVPGAVVLLLGLGLDLVGGLWMHRITESVRP